MSIQKIYFDIRKVSGENFGAGRIVPIVTVNGDQCFNCSVVNNHSVIYCSQCPGGAADIEAELLVTVDFLLSSPFLFSFQGNFYLNNYNTLFINF